MKWVALNHQGKPIAVSSCRSHFFHILEILGISPYNCAIARTKD